MLVDFQVHLETPAGAALGVLDRLPALPPELLDAAELLEAKALPPLRFLDQLHVLHGADAE